MICFTVCWTGLRLTKPRGVGWSSFLPRQAVGLGAPQVINGCHDGHFIVLSRCRRVGSCVRPWRKVLYVGLRPRLNVWRSHRQSRIFVILISIRNTNKFHFFFRIFKTLFTVSFTMVIKWSPGGKSAGGRWSTSKSTCVDLVPAWTLTSEKASFGVRASRWLHQLTFDPKKYLLFWKCMQMVARLHGLVWKQFQCHPGGCVRLLWEACVASCTRASCFNNPLVSCIFFYHPWK